ncbi:GvpL/GvpF family gas vesicle protein [Streptomyces sp. NA02950]|uniref:GvpL/GvpF family gas vesicle protein n=1 Tax=Streptomyces sp. NA02950 TaxID=2742137 RepID=UPI00159116E6|nr:GvpL/GvpF family gas vesicle protein [Streptomyces sp. NA02950]QKV92885.1 GvpL/GvpF family gas vesicle protein [Streptomyces sp. NA02950]
MTATRSTLTYVFAVCRPSGPEARTALGGLTGVGPPAPVRTLAAGPLTAVVQDVPAADYAEEALRQRLSDRAELERCARAHHEVITAAMAAAPTVPLPLATLYRGDERAREALREREDSLLAALTRITGRVEWGVKVYALAGQPTDPAAAPGAAAASGRAYLEQIRGRQRGREERRGAALRAAERVDTVVRGLAVATRRLRPHGAEVTGPRRTHVLNAAYLVDRGRERQVRAALASLRRDETAVEIELSGPWAPYSFADGGAAS